MANKTPIDLDTLSDEEFMKLNPSELQAVIPVEEEEVIEEEVVEDDVIEETQDTSDGSDNSSDGDDDTPPSEPVDDTTNDGTETKPEDTSDSEEHSDEETGQEPEKPQQKDAKPNPPKGKDEESDDDSKGKNSLETEFYSKITAPFKADGKEIQVKTPEEAVRLMQMGVNYSRRMQELKPLRAQDQMLRENGLNSVDKLNFLIDLSKGNKDAIKKLLKDNNIDPIDIDTSVEDKPYTANNYEGDPKDLAFDDAIKETLSQEGGRELISDINKEWDNFSKEALRDQPSIFNNLLAQKRSGVYSKVKTELEYQRTMGYLTNVPFVEAYHQVATAMQNAGVFNKAKTQTQPAAPKPLGTGTRKAAHKPKIEQPNPNVSSATPPRSVPVNTGRQNEPDYSSMSDEDFLKLAPPS